MYRFNDNDDNEDDDYYYLVALWCNYYYYYYYYLNVLTRVRLSQKRCTGTFAHSQSDKRVNAKATHTEPSRPSDRLEMSSALAGRLSLKAQCAVGTDADRPFQPLTVNPDSLIEAKLLVYSQVRSPPACNSRRGSYQYMHITSN